MLPNDFPPVSTVRCYFYDWRDNGLLKELNCQLVAVARQAGGRAAGPSAGVIDSQSVTTTASGGVRGYNAGKRIKRRERHIVTDTIGLLVGLAVHGAYIQDRDEAVNLLRSISNAYPLLRHVFADGDYAGSKLRGRWRRSDAGHCKSTSTPTPRKASRSSAADGWLSGLLHGLEDVAKWQRTGRKPSQVPKPVSSSPKSGELPACSQAHDK
jgi:transposase